MNNLGKKFCFLYRKIADFERWSVADESSYVFDNQFPSDIQVIASNSIPTTTTTFHKHAGRSENMENSSDTSSIENTHHDSLRHFKFS